VLPYHFAQAFAAATKYDYPASGMTVIGVTGTNGKSTTVNMIFQMLKSAGKKVGLMSTVNWGSWQNIREETMHMTTASPRLLNHRIAELRDEGVEYLVLEVSSHALSQNRIFGIPIAIAVMTNVTHEHLDYHRTFARYLAAKEKLFQAAKFGVVNFDDPNAAGFLRAVPDAVTYGMNGGDLLARRAKLDPRGVEYFVKVDQDLAKRFGDQPGKLHIKTQIPGEFNISNSLAATAVGLKLGLRNQEIEQGIYDLTSVNGRMNRIDEGQKFTVIMDYAHTPDAFAKLFHSVKPKGRTIVVFGSAGGHRDPSKREPQGEIAGEHADIVVLTEEDDRETPGTEILDQIATGAEKAGKVREKDLFLIGNRTEAIRFAFQKAQPNDLVLLLGKGHERTIERADGEHPWNEEQTARQELKKLLNRKK
jgi:UDP-N-acetylmuramoyl-L-alanyl-D-glutamate--2,6-diaminopimelate ligase